MNDFDGSRVPRTIRGRFAGKSTSPPETCLSVVDIADARTNRYERTAERYPGGTPWAEPDFWREFDRMQLEIPDHIDFFDTQGLADADALAAQTVDQSRLLISVRAMLRSPNHADQGELDAAWDALNLRYTNIITQLNALTTKGTTSP